MRTPRPHRVGDTLAGRYRLISPLGEGGFGAAFRAWDNKQGLPVVLKMPLARHLDRPVVLERFSREVARLRDCRHPHIVPIVHDGRDDNGRPFIVMRFLPGGSLADRKKPVGPKTLHCWLPQVAKALDYIHAQGVVHRDVKPPNIFFDTQATAFLGDFGIAKLIDDAPDELSGHDAFIDRIREEESLTRTGRFIGTAVYMAPEGFEDRPIVSPQMDQYSLAVSVYEMLAGELPFRGTFDQIRDVHRSWQPLPCPPRLHGLPPSVFSSLRKALNRKPEDRFSSCEAFAAAAITNIPFTPVAASHHRFMCPGCGRLVRVPGDFGGRSCRCPDCRVALRVSHDLDALWKREEDPTTREISSVQVVGNFHIPDEMDRHFDAFEKHHGHRPDSHWFEQPSEFDARHQPNDAARDENPSLFEIARLDDVAWRVARAERATSDSSPVNKWFYALLSVIGIVASLGIIASLALLTAVRFGAVGR